MTGDSVGAVPAAWVGDYDRVVVVRTDQSPRWRSQPAVLQGGAALVWCVLTTSTIIARDLLVEDVRRAAEPTPSAAEVAGVLDQLVDLGLVLEQQRDLPANETT